MTSARIIVGVDNSPRARSALFWAAEECQLRRCPLLIVHASDATDETTLLSHERAADQLLNTYAMLASARQPTVAVSTLPAHAPPEEALVRLSMTAVMLVLGSTQRSSPAALSRRVAAHAHCPVVVIPPRAAGTARTARILVATASGPSGQRARAFAREEALVHSATTQIVMGQDGVNTVLRQSARDELAVSSMPSSSGEPGTIPRYHLAP
jgi:nucleotide-binding universal stress UspA family protein